MKIKLVNKNTLKYNIMQYYYMRFFSYLVCLVGIVDSFKHLAMNSRSFELNTIPIRDPFDKNRFRRYPISRPHYKNYINYYHQYLIIFLIQVIFLYHMFCVANCAIAIVFLQRKVRTPRTRVTVNDRTQQANKLKARNRATETSRRDNFADVKRATSTWSNTKQACAQLTAMEPNRACGQVARV